MTTAHATERTARARGLWLVVADRELRDLWVGGRGLPLLCGYALLLSVSSYLVAANQALNFLEQREAISLTAQVAVVVGGLLVLLSAADAISGERERRTLETLLLTPVPRSSLLVGKAIAALSLWGGAYAVTVPYLWVLSRGVDVLAAALAASLIVGSLLALLLAGFGLVVSAYSSSNRLSLSVSFLVLLALYAPTQLPTSLKNAWGGELVQRADPFASGMTYLGKVVIDARSPIGESGWLVGPTLLAAVAVVAVLVVGPRIRLGAGGQR